MAKTQREIIIATFIISCAATVLSIVSIATEAWVVGELKPNKFGLEKANVNYGLFGGTMLKYLLGGSLEKEYKLAIACIFEENICGYSTAAEGDKRRSELQNILDGHSCINRRYTQQETSRELLLDEVNFDDSNFEIESFDTFNLTDKMRYSIIKSDDESTTISSSSTTTESDDVAQICDKTFLNGGLWLTSTFFLSLSIMMGAITATISVMNTAGNPVSPWLNIWGLYIWNSLASFFSLLTLILYGSQFGAIITSNVSVVDTLNGDYSNQTVGLGFSYWLLLAPFLLHIVNNGLFYYRQYLIDQEPQITEDKFDSADRDGMIFVY